MSASLSGLPSKVRLSATILLTMLLLCTLCESRYRSVREGRILSSTCSVENSVDYFATKDLASTYASSPDDCCSQCQADSDCAAYTYVTKNWTLNCYLKHNSISWTSKPCSYCISGTPSGGITPPSSSVPAPIPATPTTGSDACAGETGIDYYSPVDLASLSATSAEGCCALCSSMSSCQGWTFVDKDWTLNCYLKGATGWKRKSCPECTSGAVNRSITGSAATYDPSPSSGSCSPRAGVDFYSPIDLTSVYTATAEDCCAHCSQNPLCWGWTWVTLDWDLNCYSKGSSGWQEKSCDHCISGIDSRASTLEEISGSQGETGYIPLAAECSGEAWVDLNGGDLQVGGVEYTGSAQACCDRCRSKATCYAWTFLASGYCYMKGSSGYRRQDCPGGAYCISGEVDRTIQSNFTLPPLATIPKDQYIQALSAAGDSSWSEFEGEVEGTVDLTFDEFQDFMSDSMKFVGNLCLKGYEHPCSEALKSVAGVVTMGKLGSLIEVQHIEEDGQRMHGASVPFEMLVDAVCVLPTLAQQLELNFDYLCESMEVDPSAFFSNISIGGFFAQVSKQTLMKIAQVGCKKFDPGQRIHDVAHGRGFDISAFDSSSRKLLFFEELGDFFYDVGEATYNAVNAVGEGLSTLAQGTGEVIKDVVESGVFEDVAEAVGEGMSSMGGAIVGGMANFGEFVAESALPTIGGVAISAVGAVGQSVKQFIFNGLECGKELVELVG